jgi:type IX secretion system PorP/SprF family membrane protein
MMKPKQVTGVLLMLIAVLLCGKLSAQDPVFSQFYASPLSMNPALAGNGDADWRLVGIHRAQWISSGVDPLNTTSLSLDGKLFRQKDNEVNYIGGGVFFLQDRGMNGAYKNTSFNAILSSHISLDADDVNGLSVGIGGTYSNTYIDFAALSFPSQLSSSGFNRSLPTAEPYLSNIKPYYSLSGGIDYTYSTETMGFDIGIAGYRFMKTHRSALNDKDQLDPPRYNIHANYQTYLSDKMVFNANGMYVIQSNQNTYMLGMNIGSILTDPSEESPTVLNTGLWYRKNEAIIPYLGLTYGNITGGITYDIPSGSSGSSLSTLKTFELSLILRSPQKKARPIPCPWK